MKSPLLPLLLASTLALPAVADAAGQSPLRRALRKHRVKSTHVVDFTSGHGVFGAMGVRLHRGPQNARFKGQFPVVRGTKLLVVIPAMGKSMVLTHQLMRPQDFGRREWYERARRVAERDTPYELLDGNIPLGEDKQGVLVRVKKNVPKASDRLAGSNLVLRLVKPDKRSSKPMNTIYALQAHLLGGRADVVP